MTFNILSYISLIYYFAVSGSILRIGYYCITGRHILHLNSSRSRIFTLQNHRLVLYSPNRPMLFIFLRSPIAFCCLLVWADFVLQTMLVLCSEYLTWSDWMGRFVSFDQSLMAISVLLMEGVYSFIFIYMFQWYLYVVPEQPIMTTIINIIW